MFGTVFGLRTKANTDCPGSLILEMSQESPSDMATRSLIHSHSQGQTCTFPPSDNTNKACLLSQQLLGKQMRQQPCAHYFSKARTFSWRFQHFFSAYDTSLIKAHFIIVTTHDNSSQNILKTNPKRPDVFKYVNYDTQGIKFRC